MALRIGSRDVAIRFGWERSMAEFACAMIVSLALAKSFDAVIYHHHTRLFLSEPDLVTNVFLAVSVIPPRRPHSAAE